MTKAEKQRDDRFAYIVAVLPGLSAGEGGLSQALVETTGGESIRYVYGHNLLAEYDGTSWAYHLNDGLGSAFTASWPMATGTCSWPRATPPSASRCGARATARRVMVSPGSGGRLMPNCSSCGPGTMSRGQGGLSTKILGQET